MFANKCNYDHNICMIHKSYTSDTQSLPHVSRSVLHDCGMEKNRAPTTEKTQKVSQTRSLRFSNPVLLHFKIPGPCFFCNGTGILQSGTGKLHERTESNGSFVKGHLTGRKLTTTQCRYYVDQEVKQEVKNTLPQDLHNHFINPTHKNHQKAGKTNGKIVILYSRTNVIMIIIYLWFIIHTRLTHSPCRTSHALSCTTAT